MNIAMMISGGGTTVAAIIDACQSGRLTGVKPALVIAGRDNVPGIEKVKAVGMNPADIIVINLKTFQTPEEFGKKIIEACEKYQIDLIDQCGWLRLTPENVTKKYQSQMINQHPGPLDYGRPDFGGKGMFGMRVHAARLEFVRRTNHDFWSEAAIQRVAVNFDEGMVLNKERVEILPDDTPETLQQRMLPIEHKLQIKTLQEFADGTIKEITRDVPLVKPKEYQILEECKQLAIQKYPKG